VALNAVRKQLGLEPWKIAADAYEPLAEREF
jgi:hypothetical protein